MTSASRSDLPDQRTWAGILAVSNLEFRRAVTFGAASAAFVALLGLLGYVPGLRVLGSVRPDYIPMAPSTAACFIILSVALFHHTHNPWRGYAPMAMIALVLLVMAFALLDVIGNFVGMDLNFEDRLVPAAESFGKVSCGRMSPVTAAIFFVAGLGAFLLLLRGRTFRHTPRLGHWALCLGVLTVLTGSTVLLSYLYGMPLMYGSDTIPMAATTALAFLFLAVALIAAAGPESYPMRQITGNTTCARLSRTFLPLITAAVFLQSIFYRFVPEMSSVNEALFLAVLAILTGTITAALVVRVAYAIGNSIDEAEQHRQALLEAMPDGIVVVDTKGRIVVANAKTEALFGYAREELLGQQIEMLLPERNRAIHPRHRERYFGSPKARVMSSGLELLARQKDGSEFPVNVSLSSMETEQGRKAIAVVHDITERKQAEDALGVSEARFRRLFEAARDGILILDVETGMVVDVNPFMVELLGYSREQFMEKRIWELGFFKDILANQDNFQELQRKEYIRYENLPLKTAGGRQIEVEFVSNVYLVGQKKVIQCNIRDITERIRTEKDIRTLARFPSENPGPVLRIAHNGTLLYVNEAGMKSLSDWSLHIEQLVPSFLQDVVRNALDNRMPQKAEYTHCGRIYLFNVRPVVEEGYTNLYGIDITEHKRTEEALQESNQLFSRLAEQTRTVIWEVDADGLYTYLSPLSEPVWGYRPEDIVGKKHFYDLHPEEGLEAFKVKTFEVFARMDAFRDFENPVQTKDGRVLWVSTNGIPISDTNGALSGYRGSDADITPRIKAEQERKKMEAQFHQSQKMEVIGQLAGGVAHDFNNLLQIMQGYTQLTMRTLDPSSDQYKDLQEVHRATEAAATLTRQLLAIGRKQPIQPEQVDINTVVKNLSKMLHRVIGENVAISLVLAGDIGTVLADPGHIEQVLLNLCVNARDAMPEGGRLVIETQNVFLNGDYCATNLWARQGEYVLLTVSDTGTGMTTEVQERIFEPFFTTKDTRGTGLGLSTVYGIVGQHHGHISVYSEIGVGTTFRIYLPTVDADLAAAVEIGKPPALGGTETILLAEDDERVRKLTNTLLVKAGYTVLQAVDGEEAVKAFEEAKDKIDLVMLDVIMPKMSGRLAYGKIKALKPDTLVLFSSGYSSEAFEPNFFASEKVLLLQKPFNADELLRTLRELLDKRASTRNAPSCS